MVAMKRVVIYTDGACRSNPGPGGWAAVLLYGDARKEVFGAEAGTTNNQMELSAAIEALRCLKEPCEVHIYTDSEYLQKGMTTWLRGWKAKGWRRGKKGKQTIKNLGLWKSLDEETRSHEVHWHWIKAHNETPENERCDALANWAIDDLLSQREMGATRTAPREH